jgi:hypothetical protein
VSGAAARQPPPPLGCAPVSSYDVNLTATNKLVKNNFDLVCQAVYTKVLEENTNAVLSVELENGGCIFLRSVGIYLPDYTVSQCKHSEPYEPEDITVVQLFLPFADVLVGFRRIEEGHSCAHFIRKH